MLLLALLLIPCTGARLVDVRSARHDDFTRIVFETDEKISYAIENRSLGDERAIELSLPAAASEMILRAVHEPATSVQVEALDGGSRALVRVTGPVDVWTNQLGNPPRVVLDLRVAEPVAGRDLEALDAFDYQIVVEADPRPPVAATPSTASETLAASDPDPDESVGSRGGDPLDDSATGWAQSPMMWWTLAAVGVAFLVVLYRQRIAQRRGRDERAVVGSRPAPSPRKEKKTPVVAGSVPAKKPASEVAPAPPPERPRSPLPGPSVAAAAASLEATAPDGAETGKELFALMRRIEERLTVLEREMQETRLEGQTLREQGAAHADEIRAHRAAVTRLLRRPARTRTAGTPAIDKSRSPSSS